jgi:zinc transport system permease protein
LDSQADERAGPRHEEGIQIPPAATAIFLTILVSLLLARRAGAVGAGGAKTSEETLVGLLFILGSALTLIFAVKADKAAHEIQDVLFGVAVMVPREQQSLVMVVGVAFIAVYLLMFKDFLFVSFDPVVATVAGFPVGWANSVLFILMAVVISVCTRAVGAMPVFALTVLPPTAALQIHDRIVPAAITSAVLGGAAAGLGYFATGIWELPVGPCIVLAAAIPALAAWSVRRVLSWHKVRGERKQTLG